MKIVVSEKVTDSEPKNTQNVENMKTRKTLHPLHPLQESAVNKENLVGAGRMPPSGKDADKSHRKIATPSSVSKIEKKKYSLKTDKKITGEDLTSQAGPSDHYWEVVAERRRVALESALQENRELSERITLLEEENEQCKQLLEESKFLLKTLTEMLNSSESD
ncbi:geminin DNA replication inhibitor [Lycorma delicatula]|uniref:geminin DNA replication inhibitor n=1 Tax=Lycorma delicatula TaxID=130591 RepID=UPI003F50F423